jgi:16S rRNA (adenine1518-N6/adenine1519-N6)-dimethyltransferase
VLEPYANVEVIHGDILQLPTSSLQLPNACKVVANIPYYITSALIRRLLEAEVRPSRIVLTVQREVAERMCAGPGEMSLLAVSVQFYSTPKIVARIPAGAFYPRPDVDSAVVRLDVRSEPAVTVGDVDAFFRVVKAGFSQKRKQLRNSLSAGLPIDNDSVEAALTQAGIDPKRRAETLTMEEWGRLARAVGHPSGPDG